MVLTHRQYGPRVTYQMHQPEPSEHESASSFQSAKPKRVGWWCPSSVVNWWVEITRWAKVCAVHSLNSCPASSLDLVLWALRKVCENASTCHMTSHTPWHVKLLFGGIHRKKHRSDRVSTIVLTEGRRKKNQMHVPGMLRWGTWITHQTRWVTNSSQVVGMYIHQE